MMNQSTKDSIFNMLSEALNVCNNVDFSEQGLHDVDRSPFYALGYSRSTIQAALDMLTKDQ
jgi:hypothetical protein